MKLTEYKAGKNLASYIDAYYTLETGLLYQPANRQVFADGCTEIFINVGNSRPRINTDTVLVPGNIYLGGTMTVSNTVRSVPGSRFIGIRFKPFGVSAFYNIPLDELVDKIIEFPDKELYSLAEIDDGLINRLDHFFLGKLKLIKHSPIIPITETIFLSKGMVSVDYIAKTYNLSIRTLERIFIKDIGIPPTELIKIIRFKHAANKLQQAESAITLLKIAIDTGYYDHAHLSREVKKYSGITPSQIARNDNCLS
ncbi:AraC-like DNA-binding protein [Mucilaginibacter sp. UYNi724]